MNTMQRFSSIALLTTLLGCSDQPVWAQIQPDSTLGGESSQINSGLINNLPSEVIQGGAQRGGNLFHSFIELNVSNGQQVYFSNPAGVSNILTRVTGSSSSQILGVLGVNGPANLFLINPNGIFFGSNARLDIQGSFTASTASRLTFPDGSSYSATNPQEPLLTMDGVPVPQSVAVDPGAITNVGVLQVGQDLLLFGGSLNSSGQLIAPNGAIALEAVSGDIQLQSLQAQTATIAAANNLILKGSQVATAGALTLSAGNTVQIHDTSITPTTVLAGGQLLVQGNQSIDIAMLAHPSSRFVSGGDMVFRSAQPVSGDAHYWANGNFRIEQLDGQLGTLFSPYDPVIYASGDVTIGGYLGPSLHILAGGSVTIPNGVRITGTDIQADTINPIQTPALADVRLSNGEILQINGSVFPTLDIRAGTTAFGTPGIVETGGPFGLVQAPALIINAPVTGADITIGSIQITAPNGVVLLTTNYAPNLAYAPGNITVNNTTLLGVSGVQTSVAGGNSGSVTMDARGDLTLNTPITTSSATANAGNITLLSQKQLTINQSINADTTGSGSAGRLYLSAPDIVVQGANLSVNTFGSGSGGNILLEKANNLTLRNSQFSAVTGTDLRVNPLATTNSGIGGTITLDVSRSITLSQQSVLAVQSNQLSTGAAGNLSIKSNNLRLEDGSLLTAVTQGSGSGGNITLAIANTLDLIGTSSRNTQTGIFLNTFGAGNAGQLTILGGERISLQAGALIADSASSSGRAGNLIIDSPQANMVVTGASNVNASSVLSATRGSGDAGNIAIQVRQLTVQNGGQIDAQTLGSGQAGTLSVNALDSIQVSGSSGNFLSRLFFDSSGSGNAGALVVQAPTVQVSNRGQISARTRSSGQGGIINITAPDAVTIDGGSLLFDSSGSGNPRGIQVTTGQLTLRNGGQMTVSSVQAANAGNLFIQARDLLMSNGARLTATTASGEGGNINIQIANSMILRYDSDIRTSALGTGNGGNIRLEVGGVILGFLAEDSDVIASAVTGRGGAVFAKAAGILGFRLFDRVETAESDFVASSELGIDGTVSIEAQTPQPLPPLALVPVPPLSQGCVASANGRESRFTDSGRGGLPISPNQPLSSRVLARDTGSSSVPVQLSQPEDAQGWIWTSQKTVMLVAMPGPAAPMATYSSPTVSLKCHGY